MLANNRPDGPRLPTPHRLFTPLAEGDFRKSFCTPIHGSVCRVPLKSSSVTAYRPDHNLYCRTQHQRQERRVTRKFQRSGILATLSSRRACRWLCVIGIHRHRRVRAEASGSQRNRIPPSQCQRRVAKPISIIDGWLRGIYQYCRSLQHVRASDVDFTASARSRSPWQTWRGYEEGHAQHNG